MVILPLWFSGQITINHKPELALVGAIFLGFGPPTWFAQKDFLVGPYTNPKIATRDFRKLEDFEVRILRNLQAPWTNPASWDFFLESKAL